MPARSNVNANGSANECERLTLDHRLVQRFGCMPQAALDWAVEVLAARRAVPNAFLLAFCGAVFHTAKGGGAD